MATTTNYGWTTPNDTDLVKDGASAIRTLGQSIDTTFAELKGGTSGQMLTKASATDLDLVWITPEIGDITSVTATSPLTGGGTTGAVTVAIQDATTAQKGSVQLSDSTSTTSSVLASTPTAVKSAYDLANAAIAKSTVTTAGDIIYRNATVPTRLGIGTAGQVLKVNSGATAPEWGTAATGGLTLITTTTLSGVTSQSINSCFSATYNNYLIVLNAYCATTGDSPTMKLRASSTDSTTGYYGAVYINNFATGSVGNDYQNNEANWRMRMFGELTTSSTNSGGSFVQLYNPFNAAVTSYSAPYLKTTTNGSIGFTGGMHNVTTSYDGFTITNSTAMTGTIRVYGLAN